MNLEDPRADEPPLPGGTTVVGARWAVGLGVALLVALTLLTAVRWLGKPAAIAEEIVQIPVPDATPTPSPRPEVLAPDPGDHP